MKQTLPAAILYHGIVCLLYSCGNKEGNNKGTTAYQTDTAIVGDLLQKARYFRDIDYDSMRYYAEKASVKSVEVNFRTGFAKAIPFEARYQRRKGNYTEAITLGLEAIRLFDSLGLRKELANTKNFVADCYKQMGGEKKTVAYQQKGLELAREAQQIAEQEKDIPGLIDGLNEEGIILRDMSKTINRPDLMDSAFMLYKRSVGLIETTGEGKDQLAKLYNNISQVYNEHYKDYAMALDYQSKGIANAREKGDKMELTHSYNNMSAIYRRMGDLQQAIQYAHMMLALSKELRSPFREVTAYLELENVNRQMNRHDSVVYYNDIGNHISDSINNLEKGKQIAEMQSKYESDKKQIEIGFLNNSNRNKSQWLWAMAGAALLLLSLLSVVWLQKKRISKQSEKLAWMMREIHHRVKNNLQIISSLLDIQSDHIQDEKVLSSIQEGQSRVQAMSLIHQNLYQSEHLSNVDIENYLQQLIDYLSGMFAGNNSSIQVKINASKINFDIDTAIPLGLIVNELVSNAYKYAFDKNGTGHIQVMIKPLGNIDYELHVTDDGKGLPEDFNPEKSNSLGLKLVKILSRQLRGSFSSFSGKGASFVIKFKDLRAWQATKA